MSDSSSKASNYSSLTPGCIHVQMNNYDYYMASPSILDSRHGYSQPMKGFSQVPIIRVFGSLPTGHQVLCHVHGIFPYFMVPYDGDISDSTSAMNAKCAQLHLALETNLVSNSSVLKYVANVSVVKAVPFYGYHVGWKLYYKVSLLNPQSLTKIADLVRSGKILQNQTEVYEAHIPYLLQFSSDYNLFGCSWLKASQCYFRKPILNNTLDMNKLLYDKGLQEFMDEFLHANDNVLPSKSFQRMGNGLLEIDILPQSIQNRNELEFIDLHHDFIEKNGQVIHSASESYITSTAAVIKDINLQRNIHHLEVYSKPPKISRVLQKESEWHSLKEFKTLLAKAEHNTRTSDYSSYNFENFIQTNERYDHIERPSDAIPELWPLVPHNLQQKISGIVPVVSSTMETETNPPKASLVEEEEEEDDDDEGEGDSFQSQGSAVYSYINNEDSEPQQTLDLALTQAMARKRHSHLPSTVSSKRRKSVSQVLLGLPMGKNAFTYRTAPIKPSAILMDLESDGYPKIDYHDPFFSNPIDLNKQLHTFAGKRFVISSPHLSSRLPVTIKEENVELECNKTAAIFLSWKYAKLPPTYKQVKNMTTKSSLARYRAHSLPGRDKLYHKTRDQNLPDNTKKGIHTSMTHLSLEIHVNTRGEKRPDPSLDELCMLVWALDKDTFPLDLGISTEGIMIVKSSRNIENIQSLFPEIPVVVYDIEDDMIDALADLVLVLDPDILSGFETNSSSWGYVIERFQLVHKYNFREELSRVNTKWNGKTNDPYAKTHTSSSVITGRHMINLWRALRSEVNLTRYSIENVAYNVLNQRLPHFSFFNLRNLWNSNDILSIKTVVNYWLVRVKLNIKILQKLEYIPRMIEQARLVGIDFYSVYYRGSQFKVESFLIRLCKSQSFALISPSKKAVRDQKPLECVPLIMEPESAFYKSPLLVLDFQSLYPSIMIAYNYCYSTMIGRVRTLNILNNEIGVTKNTLDRNLLSLLENDITIAPNGMVYAKETVRQSTLAKMLKDILDTRVMVKKTMSDLQTKDPALAEVLNNRQLALKLLANVTYGYTSASFSGRMPSSDLADSIVQTGREILVKAIAMIESNDEWGAKVVYGDTDSLFVYLPGKSAKEAFEIGNGIAKYVTKHNLDPVTLKFEKVYHPCILVSKKRYVGYAYGKSDQTLASFDAKGIETVRRDGYPAQQQIVERALHILFRTKDISQVKRYVQKQFAKIHNGDVSVRDFCFAKEVKLGTYKSDKTAPPGALIAMKQMEDDIRAEPQYKERIPYVVIKGKAGQILRERCVSPSQYMSIPSMELDSEYYITKTLVPPLERLFNIIGIDVASWAKEVPRNKSLELENSNALEKFLKITMCVNCSRTLSAEDNLLCALCSQDPLTTATKLQATIQNNIKTSKTIATVCRTCSYRYTKNAMMPGSQISSLCDSHDCPVYYSRMKSLKYINSKECKDKTEALELLNRW